MMDNRYNVETPNPPYAIPEKEGNQKDLKISYVDKYNRIQKKYFMYNEFLYSLSFLESKNSDSMMIELFNQNYTNIYLKEFKPREFKNLNAKLIGNTIRENIKIMVGMLKVENTEIEEFVNKGEANVTLCLNNGVSESTITLLMRSNIPNLNKKKEENNTHNPYSVGKPKCDLLNSKAFIKVLSEAEYLKQSQKIQKESVMISNSILKETFRMDDIQNPIKDEENFNTSRMSLLYDSKFEDLDNKINKMYELMKSYDTQLREKDKKIFKLESTVSNLEKELTKLNKQIISNSDLQVDNQKNKAQLKFEKFNSENVNKDLYNKDNTKPGFLNVKDSRYINKEKLMSIDSQILNNNNQYINFITIEINNSLRKSKRPCNKICYKLVYRATRDTDMASMFHLKCDNIKSNLVIIQTYKNCIFGGFTNNNWKNSLGTNNDNYKMDEYAFCFNLNKTKIYPNCNPKGIAITCNSNSGPIFGNITFKIFDNFFKKGGQCHSRYNNTYGGQQIDYEISDGEGLFQIKELEVFEIIIDN